MAPPRPGVDSVRSTQRMCRLYFSVGTPALLATRIICRMFLISSSRSGLFPSITFLGYGTCTISRLMSKDSKRLR